MIRWSLLVFLLLNSVNAGKGEPPRIDDAAQTKFRVPIGTKLFKLTCPILPSDQNVMVQWSRNGETMDFDEQYKITRDNREVRMKNLKTEDSGRYECQVINGFGHISVEFILQVYDPATDVLSVGDRITMAEHSSPPYWLDDNEMHAATSQPKRIHIGGKLELKCAAKGNPVPELRWFKNDQILPQNGPIDSAILVVDGVKEGDGGNYRCEVANKNGYKQATFKVVVADFFDADNEAVNEIGPIPIIDHPYNISVQIGRTSQFLCKAKAEDTPLTKVLIRWLKELTAEEKERLQRTNATVVQANGKSLMVIDERQFPGKEIIGGQNYFTNRLIIPSTEMSDQGRYICVVTDTGGRIVYRTAELYIERGLRIGDLHLSSSAFWWIAIPVSLIVLLFVIFGVMYLRMTQKVEVKEGKGQPPPPRIPPPITPSQDQIFPQQHMHHPGHYFDQPQSPLLLQNAMFQNGRGPSTMDRLHTPHRLHRGSSNQPLLMAAPPQMIDHPSMMERDHRMAGHHTMGHGGYFHSPHHPAYAPSSNYRTLDINYCRDPHPSLYSSDYGDQHSPFINISRTHDL
ncbi:igcm-4 [Pristionchus pacificus]|uniref:Igcm-4 n=1 Tax=Pristionchus pacificus TaxID=54126 RepID=A0A2A6BK00_PRIPA|nr:igcm-4 [Pristionchus pacificus]|eukprot:PDM66245.1 igcm-4 [Pristionchus pacificus]